MSKINQMDILKLKNTMPWIKNSLFFIAENRIYDNVDRAIEIIYTKGERERERKRNEENWIDYNRIVGDYEMV